MTDRENGPWHSRAQPVVEQGLSPQSFKATPVVDQEHGPC
jgi:hypothetical protein